MSNEQNDNPLNEDTPESSSNIKDDELTSVDFKTLFEQNVYKYPDWYMPIANKARRMLKYHFALYFFMTIVVMYIWPWMYGNPFVPAKYPEWYTTIINFCLEYIPSTQRHANFFRPVMRGFIPATYTLMLLFFVPILINCALLDLEKLSSKLCQERVKKIGPMKHYLHICVGLPLAVIGLFYFGLDEAPRVYEFKGVPQL